MRRRREDKRELQNELGSAQNQLGKYERLKELAETGELENIIKLLNTDESLKQRISEISREQEHLRQKRRSLKKERRQWERYRESERNSLIAEAVNDFVCPACGDRVDVELAESRLSNSRCPFCAVDDRADELEADIDDKLEDSDSQIEEIDAALEEVQSRLEDLNESMNNLRDSRSELSQVDGPIETVIRSNEYELVAVIDEVEEELERYQSTIETSEAALIDVEEEISHLEERLESNEDELEQVQEDLRGYIQASLAAEIGDFSERWEEVFQSMAGELGLDIQIDGDGAIEIPGNDGPRNYDRAGDLSDAEITFLNISFAVTINRYAREAGITEWATIVCDEPFSNLDDEGQERLLEFIGDAEEQFICTSSDSSLTQHFPKSGELSRGQIQTELERFFA